MAQHAPLIAVDCAPLGTICRQPSAVKSIVMAGRTVIELPGPIRLPGIGRGVPSFASWLAVRS